MEANEPVTCQRWLGIFGIGVVSLFATVAFSTGDVAAANVANSGGSVTRETSLGLAELGLDAAVARSSGKVSVRRKVKKPRVWKMPVTVAKSATMRSARSVYANTSPNDFDDSGSIIGESDWDYYTAGGCQRKSRSRVNCVALVEGDFDIVDDQDQVTGEDTYYCIWEQTNWYPRARKKRLKTDISRAYCGWESEDK